MELEGVLGKLYFKKALFELKDFNDKSIVKGIAVEVESEVQRGKIVVYLLGDYNQENIVALNSSQKTFNSIVQLENPILSLKENGKYKIECTQINMLLED